MTSALLASVGEVGWTTEANNALSHPQLNGLRLTLTSGTPVTTADVSTAATLYWTPYTGNRVSLYDGTNWQAHATAEISLALAGTSATTNYDVFVYDNSGVVTIDSLVAWTNDTTRATSLVRQDGVWVKSGATTRRYVGTIRTTVAKRTDDAAGSRLVFNAENRVQRRSYQSDTTAAWTTTSTSFVGMNGGSAAWKAQFVVGLDDMRVRADLHMYSYNLTGGNQFSIGLDSTTSPATDASSAWTGNASTLAGFSGLLGLGYHYINGIHRVSAGTGNFWGTDTTNMIKSAMFVECWA